ncbi:A disintegrin and metalloproteinase with thrombospondin motifs 12-like [Chiloscyllium plagiosum]|uniref:A disintegrin and metalloproteinase with thrombospondin motifs 12-like n=1 Tax=Chiloscyllium plagiosum TaxID=36176 RepID=UPI001CB808E7|nr:A disintegrin and metalloproteinase with thrombospondin motifs 12-like [Chiloscyllium plagiosum]
MPLLGGRLITGVPFLFNVFSFVAASHSDRKVNSVLFADEKQETFVRSLQGYEIVHPIKVDESGAILSPDVTHYVNHVRRRDLGKREEHVYYQLVHRGQKLLFNLTLNRPFLSPGYVLEKRYGNVTGTIVQSPTGNTCHFLGRVEHQDQGSGSAAISTCRGLHGLFRLRSGDYLIEPVNGHPRQRGEQQPHIIYKRDAIQHSQRKHREFTPTGTRVCGIQDSDNNILQPERQRERWEESHRKGRRISQRSISKERWVETLVVADTKMIEYHGSENVQSYIFTIINMVASLFHEPSIGNAIHIVMVRLILLEEEEKELKIIHHADHTLSSFCKWQRNVNPKSDSTPHHHDIAVLLTRMDLCAGMNRPCETLGLSHVSGMCQPLRNCNINEDSGLPVAFTIAHEIGHSFGIQHDGQGNDCEPFEKNHFIMSRQLQYDQSPLIWSHCSKDYITRFLDRGWGFCLNDPPTQQELVVPTIAPGVLYDVHHQCQLQYGPNSTFCEEMDNVCQTLWCSVNGSCRSKLDAAADGTSCGEKKWCFNGECVTVGNRPEAVNGDWSTWGSWSHCTRTCGAGVQAAERHCSNPVPRFGGKYCTGKRKRYRICNVKPCLQETPTFRQMQCSEFNTVLYKNELYSWAPVYRIANPCELHCRPVGEQFAEKMLDAVIDGTSCTEAANSRDVCINGICKTVGCDYEIESNAVEDRCGVCHGNGSSCQTVKKTFEESEGLGYVDVGLIPEGARDIRVEEIAEAGNFLALRSEDPEKYFLNGGFIIQWNGDYKAAGTTFKYERNGNLENLTAPGPTKEPVWIQLLFQEKNPGVRYEYTIKKDTEEENTIGQPEFFWKFGAWTDCSAPCGTGVQRQIVRCVEKTPRVVEDRFCDARTRPDDRQQKCNEQDCPARWWAGEWQKCSTTCGDSGIKKRTVLCVRTVGTDEQALPSSECNQRLKPRTQMTCKRDIPCPSNWTVSNWSDCSVTCGGGFRTRNVTCTWNNKELCNISKKPSVKSLCGLRHCSNNKKILFPPRKPKDGKTYPKDLPGRLRPKYGPNHSGSKVQPKPKRVTTKQPLPVNITVPTAAGRSPVTTMATTTNKQIHVQDKPSPKQQNCNASYDDNFIAIHQNLTNESDTVNRKRISEAGNITDTIQNINETHNITGENDSVSDHDHITTEEVVKHFPFTEEPQAGIVTDENNDKIVKSTAVPINTEKSMLSTSPQTTFVSTVKPGSTQLIKPSVSVPSPGYGNRKVGLPRLKIDPKFKATMERLRMKLYRMLNPERFSNHTDILAPGLNPNDENSTNLQHNPELTTSNGVGTTDSEWVKFTGAIGSKLSAVEPSSPSKLPLKKIPTINRLNNFSNMTEDYDDFAPEVSLDDVYWKVGNWSECSTTCGVGAMWRQIECSTEEDAHCENVKKPAPARRCFVRPCAIWKIGNWSKCSENCGGGAKIRDIQCIDSHDKRPLRPFHCQLLRTKPTTSLRCNLKACADWQVSAWSECSRTCGGGGIQERLVRCMEEGQCNLKARPHTTRPCNTQPCVQWITGTWSECSASCGGGLQQQVVRCMNLETNKTEEDSSICEMKPSPSKIQKCNTQKCMSRNDNICIKDRMSKKFCLTLKKLGRCSMATIKTQCCYTCQKLSSMTTRRAVQRSLSKGTTSDS